MDSVTHHLAIALTARARLGEGPVWNPRSHQLHWVDIYNHRVHCFDPATGSDRYVDVGETVGAIALTDGDRIMMALRHSLALLDFDTGAIEPVISVEADKPHNRFNDGKCDMKGRFWFGSMSTLDGQGNLYCYSTTNGLTQMETGLTISNGLGWSPDNHVFYLTDSPLQTIWAYDFDLEAGDLANRRPLVDLSNEVFFPDGLTVDAEGCLWVAMWDGWCVVRFDPSGQEMERVRLPGQRPTSCTFGGADLDQLYITSASVGLSESEIQASVPSGDVFVMNTQTRGLPTARFAT